VLDTFDEMALGSRTSLSHLSARQEVGNLVEALKLPIDEKGRRRAAARQEWFRSSGTPLDSAEVIAE
jgi:chromosome partitioning protein